MLKENIPLTDDDKKRYGFLNQDNVEFFRSRYNHINRWVVADMLRRTSYHFPDKTALIFNDKSLTYIEIEGECNQVANALIDAGVKKYDRVAILAHNTHHHVLTWLGTAKAGGVYLAVNYLLKGKDIAYCINHSESRVFIVEDILYDLVKDILSEIPTVKTLIWSNQGDRKPAVNGFIDFDKWYKNYPDDEPDIILGIEDPVQMTYTSGTESLPKGVIISNQSLIAQYMGCIIDGGYDNTDINLNALPIYHCAQRDVLMNPIFWLGGTNILQGADISQILENIEKYSVTMFFAPPTVWIGILRHPDLKKYDISSLKKCFYGASIMPVEVLKEIINLLPDAKIYNFYGQTELAPYHTILKSEDALEKLGSAGMAGLHMESRLEDGIGNEISGSKVIGEICGKGPHAMMLYFKEPEKTEEVFKGGWFHSGDLGVFDDDRYISVVDRKKDMIKTGGENVASREVEEVIYLDNRIEEVAVIGVSHPKWVEAVVAVVVPKKGAEISRDMIKEHCDKNLARFKLPKEVVLVDALPKTPTGKILKRDMRESYKDLFA